MLSFTTKHFLLRKRETWFYNGEPLIEHAYNVYPYALEIPGGKFDKKLEERTTIIDLLQDEKSIFDNINATFRYHIRKADIMGIMQHVITEPSTGQCEEVLRSLQHFAGKKGFTTLSRKRVSAMRRQNALFIFHTKKGDEPLITHLYLGDRSRAVLLASFHNHRVTDKRLRSYANKLLHWKSILFFKEHQYKIYDFGGINAETVPGITRFKLSFGGPVVKMANYIRVKPILRPIFKLAGII